MMLAIALAPPPPGATLMAAFALAVVGFLLGLLGVRGARQAVPRFRLALRVARARERAAASGHSGRAEANGSWADEPAEQSADVALRGVASLVEEGATVDPFGGKPCVAFHLTIDRLGPGRMPLWEALIDDSEVRPFVLRDQSGVARVQPGDSAFIQFRRPPVHARGKADRRLVEVLSRYGVDERALAGARTRSAHAVIEVGSDVVAIGRARDGERGATTLEGGHGSPLILAELPPDQKLRSLAVVLGRPMAVCVTELVLAAALVAPLAYFLFR
jgi:hypothetical protein